jgi:hypothetical protein
MGRDTYGNTSGDKEKRASLRSLQDGGSHAQPVVLAPIFGETTIQSKRLYHNKNN